MSDIVYDVRGNVAVITLQAPERRNALSVQMAREITEAAGRAQSNRSVGALVVTGGAHFCAGAVRSVLSDAGMDPAGDSALRDLETIYEAFTTIGAVGVPTIAAVRGAAVGAGLNLALAADLRVVSTTAKFIPGFASLGIHPGGGHLALLQRSVGREGAAALGLFGDSVSGDRAVELGLAWAAVDDAEVETRALEYAARVAADPELARRLVLSFRHETAAGGLQWETAVEIEKAPQLWSLRRVFGVPTGDPAH